MRLRTRRGNNTAQVGPHEFQKLSRVFHRHKCRRCYFPENLHPITGYVAARPIGDKR